MNVISFKTIVLIGGWAFFPALTVSCRKEEAKASKPATSSRQALEAVSVEVRADGLAYLPGGKEPYTGEAITPHADAPWRLKLKEPYKEGKRHGDKLELFKNGTVKSLRRYDQGVPKYHALYHRNGKMKLEANLNAADKCEGPYQRWYPEGTLEATASFDSAERWHGEFKEWTKAGELKTHHIFSHGLLQQIIFESPESAAARKAIGLNVEKPATVSASGQP